MSFFIIILDTGDYLAIIFYGCQILGKVPNQNLFRKKLLNHKVFSYPSPNSFLYPFLASSIDKNL